MTFEQLEHCLYTHGIWRAEIVFGLGTMEIRVPKTSRVDALNVRDMLEWALPAGLVVSLGTMKNPLKHKKHTYLQSSNYFK